MNVQTVVSYLAPVKERAYYYLHETPDGQEPRNVRGDRREVVVEDARALSPVASLEREGVELVAWGGAPKDEHDEAAFRRDFYPEVEAMVREATGANRVFAFDHNVRSSDKAAADGTRVQHPVRLVHNDYTEKSGPQRVRDLLPAEADVLLAHRFAVINVWKPIHVPVSQAPLAVCDAQSIAAEDMIETDLRYPDRTGEIYSFSYSPEHRWLYFPDLQPEETLLIKCYDSEAGRARFTAHSAIDDPNTPEGALPRQSIEIRTFAFFGPAV